MEKEIKGEQYRCDNCKKIIPHIRGRAFQTGINKQGKIGTWCGRKCFKQYKNKLDKKEKNKLNQRWSKVSETNKPIVYKSILMKKNRGINLSPQEAFLLWELSCGFDSKITSALKHKLYHLINNNERIKLREKISNPKT